VSTIAERLAAWGHALTLRDVPAAAVNEAKRCIVDVTGVALAGSTHEISVKVRGLSAAGAAPGAAALFGARAALRAAPAAALCNAVAAHAFDYDDTCYDGIVHGSAAVWPAVLACAQTAGATGERLLEAYIVGVETEYALGRALSDRVYYKGWWTSGLLGSIGAAAGAAKLLGLAPRETCHAISLAATQATGMRAVIGTAAKPYALGRAAQLGVEAAYFAHAGLDAPHDAFESDRGFLKVIADGAFDEARFAPGTQYSLTHPGIAFKLYPACSATQAATEAVLTLLTEHRIDAAQVSAVECDVAPLVAASLTYEQPETTTQAQFSLNYAIACALRYRDFGLARITAPCYGSAQTIALMRKVSMRCDDTLEATDAGRRQNPEGARVTLHLADGRAFSLYNGAATGMPQKPVPDAELDRKFMQCAATVLAPDEAEGLLGSLRALERCTDTRTLCAAGCASSVDGRAETWFDTAAEEGSH
jgi:2-methylcitrate dehydratase PrpD